MTNTQAEYWLAGPVDGIIPVLQPVVHAVLQAKREIGDIMAVFPHQLIWEKPGGVASVAFHLQHIAGVLDRLFTYARGLQLLPQQLDYLQKEGVMDTALKPGVLLSQLDRQVGLSVAYLRSFTDYNAVFETRFVGRKQIPSNVLGLLFHAAEHTQRHTGQLLVTARILIAGAR